MQSPHFRFLSAAVAAVLSLGLLACGSDDDAADTTGDKTSDEVTSTTAAKAEEAAAFCEPYFGLEEALFNGPDDDSLGDQYLADEVTPVVEELKAAAEGDLSEQVATIEAELAKGYAAAGESFEGGPLSEAFGNLQLAAAEDCGYEKIEVDAIDFGYEGMPENLEPGKYAIVMTNQSDVGELHEIGLSKKTDDTPLDDLLPKLAAEEEDAPVEEVGGAFAPVKGAKGVAFIELDEGDYVYACFIPVGSGNEAEPPEDAKAHYEEGMKGELTVG